MDILGADFFLNFNKKLGAYSDKLFYLVANITKNTPEDFLGLNELVGSSLRY